MIKKMSPTSACKYIVANANLFPKQIVEFYTREVQFSNDARLKRIALRNTEQRKLALQAKAIAYENARTKLKTKQAEGKFVSVNDFKRMISTEYRDLYMKSSFREAALINLEGASAKRVFNSCHWINAHNLIIMAHTSNEVIKQFIEWAYLVESKDEDCKEIYQPVFSDLMRISPKTFAIMLSHRI